jgi:hypothetical protein
VRIGESADLTNIGVDPQPYASAAQALGTVLKPWKALYLKDESTSQIWKLSIVSGAITATAVP